MALRRDAAATTGDRPKLRIIPICLTILSVMLILHAVNDSPLAVNTIGSKGSTEPHRNTRKFLRYESSPWEQLWIDHVDKWSKERKICNIMFNDHIDFFRTFLKLMCSAYLPPPLERWCILDDAALYPVYYDTSSGTAPGDSSNELRWQPQPPDGLSMQQLQQLQFRIRPVELEKKHSLNEIDRIFSKLTFFDEKTGEEYTEYIEPLMSHLRFPTAKCWKPGNSLAFRVNKLTALAASAGQHPS